MKIYDTEKEARDAAEKKVLGLHNSQCGYAVKMTETSENITVKYTREEWDSWNSKVFKFKPERVAPGKNTTVISDNWKGIYYSTGEFDESKRLKCSERPDGCGDTATLIDYTPVDITPAGQFAKAVELLTIYRDHIKGGGNGWGIYEDADKLLDEIKSGGE
jgi:hypothetical protein